MKPHGIFQWRFLEVPCDEPLVEKPSSDANSATLEQVYVTVDAHREKISHSQNQVQRRTPSFTQEQAFGNNHCKDHLLFMIAGPEITL